MKKEFSFGIQIVFVWLSACMSQSLCMEIGEEKNKTQRTVEDKFLAGDKLGTQKSLEKFADTIVKHIKVMRQLKRSKNPTRRLKKTQKSDEVILKEEPNILQIIPHKKSEDEIKKAPMTQTLVYLNPARKEKFDYEERVAELFSYFVKSEEGLPEKPNEYEKSIFKKILITEQKNSDCYAFYHGSIGYKGSPGPGILFDLYTEIDRWLGINRRNRSILLRCFRECESYLSADSLLQDTFVKSKLETYENTYENGFDNDPKMILHLLPVNISLFGRMLGAWPQTRDKKTGFLSKSLGEECSLNFFFGNFSMSRPNFKKVLEEVFEIFDFDPTYLDEIMQVYQKYMEHSGGHLYQILIKKDAVDSCAYLARPGGAPLKTQNEFGLGRSSLKSRLGLGNFEKLYEKVEGGNLAKLSCILDMYVNDHNFINYCATPFILYKNDKQKLLPWFDCLQARLVIVPHVLGDESKVKIVRYYSEKQIDEIAYKRDLGAVFEKIIKDWIIRQLTQKKLPKSIVKEYELTKVDQELIELNFSTKEEILRKKEDSRKIKDLGNRVTRRHKELYKLLRAITSSVAQHSPTLKKKDFDKWLKVSQELSIIN